MPSDAAYDTEDVQQFERWSQTYEDSWLQRWLFNRAHRAVFDLADAFHAPASLLDVGCGTGRLLRAAAARWPNAQFIGVDPAQGMVDVARRLTPGATIHRGLAEALPLPDASVDLAVSTLSFHHWGDQQEGLREIARVLRPGGHFILIDIAPPRALVWLPQVAHAQPASARQRLFEAVGLRIERERRLAHPIILATAAAR